MIRATATALGLIAGYLFTATTLGSVLAWVLDGVLEFEYIKILSRGILLFAALGLIPLWRIAGLNAADLELRPINFSQLLKAYPLGLAVVAPLILFFMVSGFRVIDDRVDYSDADIWLFVLTALVSGLLVGVFEETLFRGVLFTVLRRTLGFMFSASVVGVLYSAVHFLDAQAIENISIRWYSGYAHVWAAFSGLASPAGYWDAFVALFLLGVFFCWIRERAGLWWCISLHAAWVFAIRLFKEVTVRDIYNPYEVLVSSYDNFVGLLVAFWLLFIFVVLWLARRVNST
ncbi:MAG: CPBP family intramembrane metalloprotease [Pseudomonadaceae bacterium]|nr:CPBP family intramembrane metalloprotease [Pseudomonadaceae bacterium]